MRRQGMNTPPLTPTSLSHQLIITTTTFQQHILFTNTNVLILFVFCLMYVFLFTTLPISLKPLHWQRPFNTPGFVVTLSTVLFLFCLPRILLQFRYQTMKLWHKKMVRTQAKCGRRQTFVCNSQTINDDNYNNNSLMYNNNKRM